MAFKRSGVRSSLAPPTRLWTTKRSAFGLCFCLCVCAGYLFIGAQGVGLP